MLLALLWTWSGFAYHLAFFARINPLAYVFAGFSLLAALIFIREGAVRGRLRFGWTGSAQAWVGVLLVTFALLGYPLWSWLAGHPYPAAPTFGLPCPTTIFTIGLLAFLQAPYPRSPLVVPVLWCAVGAQAAFFLGVPQDLSPLVAGSAGIWIALRARPRAPVRAA